MKRQFASQILSFATVLMATSLFAPTSTFASTPVSREMHLDLADLESFLAAPENRADLDRQVVEMRRLLGNPRSTTFLLNEPAVKYQSKLQELHECVESQCRVYERRFLYKVVSLKTDIRRGPVHAINIHLVELAVTSLKVWDADSAGNKKSLANDETSISGFRFL